MGKLIAIVANGNLNQQIVSDIKKADLIIGVDHAAYWLIQHGITPDTAIGDFDSTNTIELKSIKKNSKTTKIFPPEKDFTDMELAIDYAIHESPTQVIIYGGIGTRMDHTLVTSQMLEKFLKKNISASIQDEHNKIQLVNSNITIEKNNKYAYLSILPVSDAVEVSIDGCKYNIKNKKIRRGESIGVSNEIVKENATMLIHSGEVLLIQSKD